MNRTRRLVAIVADASSFASLSAIGWTQTAASTPPTASIAVAPQYDSTHVYVAPADVDAFVTSFLGTFSGKSTKQE